MTNARISFLIIFLLSSLVTLGQKGTIRGTVIDDATGEPLFGTTVFIKGTTLGAQTDFEGNYQIKAEAGTYDLQFSFITYRTITLSGIVVKANDVKLIELVRLQEDVSELEEVVVTANVIRVTETALLTVKKKSANLMDGISSESFKKIGASDAASAVSKVPGVSVQGGKYVFVRGLGDRYTKTTLNNMEVPGLDPDRNTIQLDLFPTNIIDNIVVIKSFTGDLPADFTGGIVNIDPKDFPTERVFNVTGSVGYNPSMHFKNNYLNYKGGKLDLLGMDDGTRELPISSQATIPSPIGDQPELTNITRKFNKTFTPSEETSKPNYSFGISLGNQRSLGSNTIGYNGAITYQNTTTFNQNVVNNNIYQKRSADNTYNELDTSRTDSGNEGNNNVLIGGLFGGAFKTQSSKIRFTSLIIQNGESTSSIYHRENLFDNLNSSIRYVMGYSERSIANFLLAGEHYIDPIATTIEWKVSPTFSSIEDKDIRSFPFFIAEDGSLSLQSSETGDPNRQWRFLDESNISSKLDITRQFNFQGRPSKLKIGSAHVLKERDFSIDNFDFLISNSDAIDLNNDPNSLLLSQNVYNNGTGTYVRGGYQGSNTYNSTIQNFASYLSSELAVTKEFKAILGVRGESYTQRYTGGDQDYFNSDGAQGKFLDNEKVLESLKFFPTANLVYSFTENMNFRASYSKTIARPSFKEKSIAQISDPISGTIWIGNLDLVETDINNYDLRWEQFMEAGQTIAISAFYKTFQNPIEVQVYSSAVQNNFTARNNGDASVLGVEFELRKNLDFIYPTLNNFSVNLNTSFIQSRLKIGQEEKDDRALNLRDGEKLEDYRAMQGQSPYLINLGLSYDKPEIGWEAGLFYNVQGPALAIVGTGNVPDIYNVPFHSLNATIKKSVGEERKTNVSLRINNILNGKVGTETRSYNTDDRVVSSRQPGTTFTFAFSYSL